MFACRCVSGTFARLPCSVNCRLRQPLGAGFHSGYTGNSVFDGWSDCAIYRGRDIRQCESPFDKECNDRGDLDLQRSFRGNRQCFRGRNGCGCGHNNDHSQRNGVQRSYYLQRNPHSYRFRRRSNCAGALLSLTIIPSSITVGNLQDTGQFLAIGTFSTSPYRQGSDKLTHADLDFLHAQRLPGRHQHRLGIRGPPPGLSAPTGTEAPSSLLKQRAATGPYRPPRQSSAAPWFSRTRQPTPGSCYPGSQAPALLATLTVYNEGLNTTGWLVTAPSATGTPNVLHCGPGCRGRQFSLRGDLPGRRHRHLNRACRTGSRLRWMVLQLRANRAYHCSRAQQLHGHVDDQRYRGSNLQLKSKPIMQTGPPFGAAFLRFPGSGSVWSE